jgi:hypothetical protein
MKVDWSKHELKIKEVDLGDGDSIIIHDLKIPNSIQERVKFINTQGVLLVVGDYGRWSFCREFHPSKEGSVSEMYWLEKLRTYSTQQPGIYDPVETENEIKELIDHGLEEYGYQGDELIKAKEFYTNLLNYVDDEHEYIYHAYRYSTPSFIDSEDIPFCKKLHIQLEIVFDAFNEICRRLKENNNG